MVWKKSEKKQSAAQAVRSAKLMYSGQKYARLEFRALHSQKIEFLKSPPAPRFPTQRSSVSRTTGGVL